MPKLIDLTGKKFNNFIVLSREGTTHYGAALWKCKCTCGKIFYSPSQAIRSGDRKSCGCKAYDWAQKLVDPKKAYTVSLNNRIALLKRNAIRFGREWNLTKEEVEKLILSKCFYCGTAPNQRYNLYCTQDGKLRRTGNRKRIDSGWITVNGIDRIDSNKGYIPGNCVPCCAICNRAKSDLDREEFYRWVRKIYTNLNP